VTELLGIRDEIVAKMERAMDKRGLDALLATSPENVAWASGAAPPSQKTVRSRLDGLRLYEEFVEEPVLVFADSLRQRGLEEGVVGVEETHLSHADFGKLAAALPGARLVRADELFEQLRMVKTPAEIDAIRDIGAAAERIAGEVYERFGAGSSEREIANFVAERYAEAGGDGLTLLVVGSGPRSAPVHAPPTRPVLE